VVLLWNWVSASDAYRQDFLNAVSFSLTLDDQKLDVSKAGVVTNNDAKGYYAVWHMTAVTLSAGSHMAVLTEVLKKQISDGSDANKDGKLDTYGPGTTKYPPCEIIAK